MTIYDHSIKTAEGTAVSLNDYRGKVMLIVNTATGCGFTPQYEGLQELYEKYGDKGLEILDIPCNQFGGQAPGSDDEIADFCQSRYGVTFRQFAKTIVNGENEEPLYTYLKAQKKGVMGGSIKWNFTKFLVDRNGNVVERYSPTTPPEKIEKRIKELL
ncbi:MAG: glutathione peroxidase [Oscillospiraceae bacterium]|nr:glutathione peroxidase [Oscillospiraceae bacterium]